MQAPDKIFKSDQLDTPVDSNLANMPTPSDPDNTPHHKR
eukprot:CAMPEP_0181465518 /NCGR_PEP_ID=MMETSP1110-20121109/35990_1 /TAXON_ID=174948 /ORGANISM="Symbiodinium sp., Strain CCMP421" /LENGTH=38 /DNA_ID= /DNA_START= /DNA_END= /DNA_ORIENTATION=